MGVASRIHNGPGKAVHRSPLHRVYQRALGIRLHMPQIHAQGLREDDLSEEVLASDFTASGPAPHIDMPTPSIVGPEEEITQPHSIEEIEAALRLLAERREQLLEGESGASFGADEDESTVRIKRPGGPGGGR